MKGIIRVLVVDDSAYVRKVVTQMLTRSPFIEVVGTAHDGQEALDLVERLQPDVVTLDLIMPRMNGVTFLQKQMARQPLPVVVVSIASESGEMALQALDAGAIDFVQKPTALATDKVFEINHELLEKVKTAAQIPLERLPVVAGTTAHSPAPLTTKHQTIGMIDAVVIGISTGGPQALKLLIPQLPADFPAAIAMVLHMPVGYTELYAKRLNAISRIEVAEAHEGEQMRPGMALLAPAGRHLTLKRQPNGQVTTHLSARPVDTPHRPSVDVLFKSAAEVYGEHTLGVVMTGMGSDGKQGAAWIKAQGGLIFTEAEETCVVYGMPRSVDEAGISDRSVPLYNMARAIIETVWTHG